MVSDDYKRCPFKILGLQRGATVEEINRAYRKAILKVHPDKCKGPHAEERAKVINNARDRAVAAAEGRNSHSAEDDDDDSDDDLRGRRQGTNSKRKKRPTTKQSKQEQQHRQRRQRQGAGSKRPQPDDEGAATDAAERAARAAEETMRRREQEHREAEERREREQREAQERRVQERMRIIEGWRKEWGSLFTEENAARWSINCNGRPLQRHEALDARERLRREQLHGGGRGAGKAC